MQSRAGDEVTGKVGCTARQPPRATWAGRPGLLWNRGHAGSIAHGIATTPANRELAEGRRAVALPLVVMDMLFFAELLVTKPSLHGGRT